MKITSKFVWMLVVLGLLVTACYPYVKDPVVTSWPAYQPSESYQVSFAGIQPAAPGACSAYAVDLIGAWVAAQTPEKETFSFNDTNSKPCQGTFDADILPLFTQANLWYPGALSCRTCHGPDVQVSYARMDLSSYQGILAGTGRDSADVKDTTTVSGDIC
jgi:hypothetical protein